MWSRARQRNDSTVSVDENALFDHESGEAMIGFDVQDRNARRNGLERLVGDMHAARRTADIGSRNTSGVGQGRREGDAEGADSGRRLSRELEEGFRDDSEDEDESGQVVAGRRGNATR
jgi:hypothetical protein